METANRELLIRSLNFRKGINSKLLFMSYNSTDKEFIANVLRFFRYDECTYNCEGDCDIVAELQNEIEYLEGERYKNIEEKDDEIDRLGRSVENQHKVIELLERVLNGNISLDTSFLVVRNKPNMNKSMDSSIKGVFLSSGEIAKKFNLDDVTVSKSTLKSLCKNININGMVCDGIIIYNKLEESLKNSEGSSDQDIIEIRKKIYR